MSDDNMNGKELKKVEFDLSFGNQPKLLNVFGCFKYTKNNNLYIVYQEKDNKTSSINYGSSHVKETSILAMATSNKKDEKIIKEYIDKITKDEKLTNFELIDLTNITGIEIISANTIEIEPTTIIKLIDKTIPKPVTKEKQQKNLPKTKKRSKLRPFIVLFLIIIIAGGSYYYFKTTANENISKKIICTKTYEHNSLNANLTETNTYNFNTKDTLETVDKVTVYKFDTDTDYFSFINDGTYLEYMPSSDTEGGWDKDDTNYTFKIIEKERVEVGYKEPIKYEEALKYYKQLKYTCKEEMNQ